MKIVIESTTKMVTLIVDGSPVPARIWEGQTESGVPVYCYVTLIAAPAKEDLAQFERELKEWRAPSAEAEAIPLRMIL